MKEAKADVIEYVVYVDENVQIYRLLKEGKICLSLLSEF